MNGWQEAAIDLTKSGEISTTSHMGANEAAMNQRSTSSSHKLPPPPSIAAPLSGSAGIDISRILQAGLIHPVTGQIVNGSLRGDDSLKKRRGRRRNVEALYSEFSKSRGLHVLETQGRAEAISHSTVSSSTSSPSPSPSDRPACHAASPPSTTPTPTQTPPQPEIVAIDRDQAGKGLMEWLRQNPSYTMDLPTFSQSGAVLLHGLVERPKQRRHRCKDPTKLDINSLTGEERVPVVHRGTGRRLGGAMAPTIKELSRWLDANSEYCVAPDWSDVVKHSGFLPEGKFSRILTEPVSKDASSRRRGRRPRSDMPKPLLSVPDSLSGLGPPLYMNGGLMGSMDSMVSMQSLGSSIPGIPISGIMAAGFPHSFSAGGAGSSAEGVKNNLSTLPMMLHSIPNPHGTAIPQHALFGVGTMMAHTPPHLSSPSNLTGSCSSPSMSVVTTTTSTSDTSSPSSTVAADADGTSSSATRGEKEISGDEKGAEGPNLSAGGDGAATISTTSRTHHSLAHLGSGGSHLTFNPFLIPGMSHGLLYPHMFLPHGGIVALPAMPPSAANGSPSSPKRRRKRAKDEGEKEEEGEQEKSTEDKEEKESTGLAAGFSHLSASSTSLSGPAEETQPGPGCGEERPSNSDSPPQEAASAEEAEEQKCPE